ncbi:MAG: UDP-N-acetylmuramate dehydrogenase [Bacteroidota bacterium]
MVEKNSSLKSYNTFSIDVRASYFSRFSTTEELSALFQEYKNYPFLIIGGGSNLLLTKDFDGLVLKNEILGKNILEETADSVLVKIGGGENWHEFVLWAVENGFGGVENMSLIPGSVGASPMQNIGAYGVEIKDVFDHLYAYHIETGETHLFSLEECQFGYRESVFKRFLKNQYVITEVCFRLEKNRKVNTTYGAIEQELQKKNISSPTIRDVSNAVIAIRQSKLPNPAELGNAGSFFKNPVVDSTIANEIIEKFPTAPVYPAENGKKKLAAGWLIENAGWKGKTVGTCGVHKLQALVLVNYGGSTGNQIYDLSSAIITDIQEKFGVTLEREVNIL